MKVGDLVNPVPGRVVDPGTNIGLCVYLDAIDEGDDLVHWKLLSNKGVIELPTWHWKLEVISENR
tara:strand:+ start:334 stop:528 length:195 start_codon:yes stop_codon:yes gene_type:complete